MDNYKRLINNLKEAAGITQLTIYQGIVTKTDGVTCTCRFDDLEVSDIRLRASLSDKDKQMLVVPKVNSAVIIGSLSGDLSQAVVLQVDEIERIEINGGKLGGLINIEDLTAKINDLVDKFNSHTHSLMTGTVNVAGNAGTMTNAAPISVPAVSQKAVKLQKSDYEDETIKH